jgi:hypothetical protein
VYQYNPQGLLWRESIVDNRGRIVSAYEYSYDNQRNRISRVIRNRAGERLAETVYTYDAARRMITSETRDFGENAISSTRYSYDSQGNLVAQQIFGSDGRPTTSVRAVWQDGLEIRNEMIGIDGRVQLRIINEYGQDGELLKKTIENIQGESMQSMQYDYIFRPRRSS